MKTIMASGCYEEGRASVMELADWHRWKQYNNE